MNIKILFNEKEPENHMVAYPYLTAWDEDNAEFNDVTFSTGGGDHWVTVGGMSARFHAPSGGGGVSPNTFGALGAFLNNVNDNKAALVYLPLLHHDFLVSRKEDDSNITVTVSLDERVGYSLTLDRPERGPDTGDVIKKETFAVPTKECPSVILKAFVTLAYALLEDNGMTIRHGEQAPMRPVTERYPLTTLDRMYRMRAFENALEDKLGYGD